MSDKEEEPAGTPKKEDPKYEDVFDVIGGMGCGQVMIYLFIVGIEASIGLCMLYFIFEIGANPDWSCGEVKVTPWNVTSLTEDIPVPGNASHHFCSTQHIQCLNKTWIAKFSSIVTEWNLVCDLKYVSKLVIPTLFFVGQLLGAIVASQVSDMYGRKKPLILTWIVMMLGQTCLGFTQHWQVYAAVRFVVGICVGGLTCVTCVLPMEHLGPKWRTLASYRIGWHIAPMILSLSAYLARDNWRYLTFSTGLICLPLLPFVIILLPESGRWLVQSGRFKEAEESIRRLARYNCREVGDLSFIHQIKQIEDKNKSLRENYSYWDLFRNCRMSVQTLVLLFAWFTAASFSYGLNGKMARLPGSVYINLIISGCAQLGVRWTVIFVINGLGRRKSFPLYLTIACICMVTIMGLELSGVIDDNPQLVRGFVLAAMCFNSGTWSCAHVYTIELYPTLIRNIATGAGNMVARIASILAPSIIYLGTVHEVVPYVIWATISATAGILVVVTLPETYGKPIPEAMPPRRWRRHQNDEEAQAHNEVTPSDKAGPPHDVDNHNTLDVKL